MRDRIRTWWRIRGIARRNRHKFGFFCAEEGCEMKISVLRYIRHGCICGPHAWIRRWGG